MLAQAAPQPQSEAPGLAVGAIDTTLETEEAAILFANGQFDVAERMLRAATEDAPGSPSAPLTWWMLFDLYEARGQKDAFDALALSYARRFERSPPTWPEAAPLLGAERSPAAAQPTISLSGTLDAGIARSLERLRKLGAGAAVLRLDFSRLTGVTAEGCQHLLESLQVLGARPAPPALLLAGAEVLLDQLHALMQASPGNALPWLLRLEILRLQNQPAAFEDASMEYCLTFEVSPPAFVAPPAVIEATPVVPPATAPSSHFQMPVVLEGQIDGLMAALERHAGTHAPLLLDCARLHRVDFNAAGQLLSCLAPLAGRPITLCQVSHLVATLFEVIGLKDIARIQLRQR